MRSERFARFLDRFHQRVTEFFVPEMFAHSVDEPLPKLFTAFFVDRLVADDSKLVRAGRHENEKRIALRCFVHSEPMKFVLRCDQRVDIQLSALNKNADLAGRF